MSCDLAITWTFMIVVCRFLFRILQHAHLLVPDALDLANKITIQHMDFLPNLYLLAVIVGIEIIARFCRTA